MNSEIEQNPSQIVCDVAIIGAGLSGLVCGTYLAKQGLNVYIIDRNTQVGGCASNFRRKEFVFDTAVHFVNGGGKDGPIWQVLKEIGNPTDFEFIPLTEFIHWKDLVHHVEISIPNNLEEYLTRLYNLFPEDASGIRHFFERYQKTVIWMLKLSAMSSAWAKFKYTITNLRSMKDFFYVLTHSVEDILSPYVKNEAAKTTLEYVVYSLAMFPKDFASLIYLLMEVTMRFTGAHYPKGGIGQFSQKLGKYFTDAGGHLMLNTNVSSVNTTKRHLDSINLQSKNSNQPTRVVKASHFVMAGDLHHFITQMCPSDSITQKYRQKILRKKPANGSITLFLGLNLDLKARGIQEGEIWVYGRNSYTTENLHQVVFQRDMTKLPLEIITIYSNIDPNCAPNGKSVLTITYPSDFTAWKLYDGKEALYSQEKARITQELIQTLKIALNLPDLDQYIEVSDLSTPLTYWKWTGNYGGSYMGWESNVHSLMKDQITAKTPYNNMFATGQWTFPGGGVTSVMMNGLGVGKQVFQMLHSNHQT